MQVTSLFSACAALIWLTLILQVPNLVRRAHGIGVFKRSRESIQRQLVILTALIMTHR